MNCLRNKCAFVASSACVFGKKLIVTRVPIYDINPLNLFRRKHAFTVLSSPNENVNWISDERPAVRIRIRIPVFEYKLLLIRTLR